MLRAGRLTAAVIRRYATRSTARVPVDMRRYIRSSIPSTRKMRRLRPATFALISSDTSRSSAVPLAWRANAGPAGPAGAQGPAGPVGTLAQVGAAKQWSSFKDFLFDTDKSDIRANETSKVTDIAVYMKQNPSVQVGIDGYADPRGTDPYNQALSERRVNAIRDALVKAGVASDKIKTSAFGEQRLLCNESTAACWQSDRRVEVLISSSK